MGTAKNVRALGVVLAASGALMLGAGMFSANGEAASATGNMPVKLTVLSQCQVSAGTLDFGNATFIDSDISANTKFTVRCTKNTKYSVNILTGQNFVSNTRNMKNASSGETIAYTLYQDSALSTAWGTVPSTSTTGTGTRDFNVYGVVPQQGNGEFTPGVFNDTVTIQVDY
jgi:spore coat protein U-like protein